MGSGSGYGVGSGSGNGMGSSNTGTNTQGFWPDSDPGSPMHGWDGRTCAALRLAYKSSECCYATLTKQTKYSFVHTHYSDFAKCGDLKTAYKESTCCGHVNVKVVLPQFYFI